MKDSTRPTNIGTARRCVLILARLEDELKKVVKKSDLEEAVNELKDFIRQENRVLRGENGTVRYAHIIAAINLLILFISAYAAFFK